MKLLKNKKGFSLVELMVVVAIMGTLASIAIPAFNEYRRSAKKNAYKADLTSLHKGWLAFGVELDSFCERDTGSDNSSIGTVGMSSLLSSKLYGDNGTIYYWTHKSGQTCPNLVTATNANPDPVKCDPGSPVSATASGPGKDNFIGFGQDSGANGCPGANAASLDSRSIHKKLGTATNRDTSCVLNVDTYKMGVGGHVSGSNYYSYNIDHNGVAKEGGSGSVSDTFGNGNLCI